MIALIVLMGPSRMLEGEHWLSDVVEGLLYGAFWLLAGIHAYRWAWHRWPRLPGRHEHENGEGTASAAGVGRPLVAGQPTSGV